MNLVNILSAQDGVNRIKKGTKIYANTDGDATQVWFDPKGDRRINVDAGKYIGPAKQILNDTNGNPIFVELEFGPSYYRIVPLTQAAVEFQQGVDAIEPDLVERLKMVLQRDRITAHRLVAIAGIIRTMESQNAKIPSSLVAEYNAIAEGVELRKKEIESAGWLQKAQSYFDESYKWLLNAVGISGVPLVVVVPLGIAAVVITVGLLYWLNNNEKANINDFTKSLDLYNSLRTQIQPDQQKQLDTLIATTAVEAKKAAQPSFLDSIGQYAVVALIVVGGIFMLNNKKNG
jgi:hypothetical protein